MSCGCEDANVSDGTSEWHLGNGAHRAEASDGLRLMVLVLVWKRSIGQAPDCVFTGQVVAVKS